jgi:hypothetical protein
MNLLILLLKILLISWCKSTKNNVDGLLPHLETLESLFQLLQKNEGCKSIKRYQCSSIRDMVYEQLGITKARSVKPWEDAVFWVPYFARSRKIRHRADFLTDTMGGQNLNQSMNQQRVIVAAVLALEKWLRG